MDRGVRTIVFLAVLALGMLALLLFFLLTNNNQTEQTNSTTQFTEFTDLTGEERVLPNPEIRREPVQPSQPTVPQANTAGDGDRFVESFRTNTTSWQDEFIEIGGGQDGEYTADTAGGAGFMPVTTNSGLNPATGQAYTIDDLRNQGIIRDLSAGAVDISIRSQRAVPPVNPFLLQEQPEENDTVEAELPKFSDDSFKACGKINASVSSDFLQNPLTGLGSEPESICMGEAIASSCSSAALSLSVLGGVISGTVYVTERDDGICGVGASIDNSGSDTLLLCDLVEVLNKNLEPEEHKNLVEWQEIFAEDPGNMFVNSITLTEAISGDANCISYSL